MKEDFLKAGYPKKLVKKILKKVIATPRSLEKKGPKPRNENVMLISTHGRDTELCEVVKENCDTMGLSVMYVKKTGPKLRSKLSNLKYISLGEKYGHTRPCGKPRCKCCPLMSCKDHIPKGLLN